MISKFEAKVHRLELVEGDGEKHVCIYTSEYTKKTRDKILTNQMNLRLLHMMEGYFTKLLIARSILMFFPSNLACTIMNNL